MIGHYSRHFGPRFDRGNWSGPRFFRGIGALHSSTLVLATTDLVVAGNSQQQSSKHSAALRQKSHGSS